MKWIIPIFLFIFAVVVAYIVLAQWNPAAVVPASEATDIVAATTTPSIQTDIVKDMLASMSLEERVGQLLMVGHWKQDYYQHTQRLVQLYHLGGIIVMDIDDEVVADVPTWTAGWQEKATTPLLISIDQEGGVVSRIRADGYLRTGQRDMETVNEAYAVGKTRGEELAALGINTNLAPVLDYAPTPDAFLYDRSFASSSTLGELATALIDGHKDAGVLAIPKHFPGHDSTPADSHFELPSVDITAADFPSYVSQFRDVLSQADVGAMMTAHVLFPQLDEEYPTTMSEEILTKQLRRELDFDGVIITDDMTMGAVTNTWTTNEAALQALYAGADMILFAAEPNAAIEAHSFLMKAVENDDLSEDRLNQSVERILRLKQEQGLLE